MKFKLSHESEYSKTTHEFNGELLSDVLFDIKCFLLGIGYQIDGELEIVKESDDLPEIEFEENEITAKDLLRE